MCLLQTIGNSIHKSFEITVKYPSNHDDDKLQILDLQVWIDEKDIDFGTERVKYNCVLHELYSKEASSKSVINRR